MKNKENKQFINSYKTNVGADAPVCPNSKKEYTNIRRGTGHRAQEPAAITLVALIITVIILIILAGVSLNLALGQNGIFVKSKEAVDKYKDEAKKEQLELENIYQDMLEVAGRYNQEKKVNTPAIKSGENFSMELVTYDEAKKAWVPDTTYSDYSYIAGDGESDNTSSHWANAKVTIDGVESFFVWIPRFAYKIDSANQKIDIVFLKDKTDEYIDEETGETKTAKRVTDNGNPENEYVVHPAFTNDVENGGWNKELSGLWIGKYETSLLDTTKNEAITSDTNIVLEETDIGKAIAVQPNMSSWRNITIGNAYTNARNYSTNLNSHMLKNSEWGAIAYLTHSQYGRNGHEININNSSNYITGEGENLATSTGNKYGIYDLSGGAYEYVAAYYSESSSLTNGSSFAKQNGISDVYATAYTGSNESSDYKKGDATYKTKQWNSDTAQFVNSSYPFFKRGGYTNEGSFAGVFCYWSSQGDVTEGNSFRMCLAVM